MLLGCCRPVAAHTFTAIAADLLYDNDELSMTLGLNVLDVIAIITNSPTSAGNTLQHSALVANLPQVQAYLNKYIIVTVNGERIPGSCLGYIPDLTEPPQPGQPMAEILPDRLPFLLVWTLPKGTTTFAIKFDLLIDVVGTGVVHANLYMGDNVQSQFRDLGATASFKVTGGDQSALTSKPKTTSALSDPDQAPGKTEQVSEESESQSSSSSLGVWHLLVMGFQHIVPKGYDHIVFVICLFLLSPKLKPLLIQVTAFTAAHSITLGLAMMGWILLPSRLIETIIALSIVVMAVENLFIREVKPWRWVLVFAFGLIHGLGFAGSFSYLQLSDGDVLRSLVLLNIGIELGQLFVVVCCMLLTFWAWKKVWYTRAIVMPLSGAFAGLGCWWAIERCFLS
jgi:hypothetical protein